MIEPHSIKRIILCKKTKYKTHDDLRNIQFLNGKCLVFINKSMQDFLILLNFVIITFLSDYCIKSSYLTWQQFNIIYSEKVNVIIVINLVNKSIGINT